MSSNEIETDDTRRMLQDSAKAFVSRSGGIEGARARRSESAGFDRKIWETMAENGWFGLLLPEDVGGLGLGFAEAAVVIEELGGVVSPEPFVPAIVLAGAVLRDSDSSDLRRDRIEGLVSGAVIPALAWQETVNEYDPTAIATRAVAGDGGFVITGTKRFIPAAAGADAFVVSAIGPDGLALYWVPRDAKGVDLLSERAVDETDLGTLTMQGVAVGADQVVVARDAAEIVERAVDEARLCASAELLGVMKHGFEMTLSYVKQREQFGRPVGKFQALQHRLVDLWIQVELSRDVLGQAVQCFDTTHEPNSRAAEVSAAKARCSEAGLLIGRESIQLHGGIGYTDAYHIGMYLKRALVLSAWLGNAGMHRKRFSDVAPEVAA